MASKMKTEYCVTLPTGHKKFFATRDRAFKCAKEIGEMFVEVYYKVKRGGVIIDMPAPIWYQADPDTGIFTQY